MKAYFASDLHLGSYPSGDSAVRKLVAFLRKEGRPGDILVLAGDLAVDRQLERCLALFSGFPGYKLAIAGNHDIWTEGDQDSWSKHHALSALFHRHGFHPLEDAAVVVGGIGLAGTMGWYDYSFRDAAIGTLDDCRRKTYPGDSRPLWMDAELARWGMGDEAVASVMAVRIAAQLNSLRDCREVIVVTHHLPTSQLLFRPRCLVPKKLNFAYAFLGSEQFAGVIGRHPNVRLAVCGHIHLARQAEIGDTIFASVGGDYESKQLLVWDGDRLSRRDFHP